MAEDTISVNIARIVPEEFQESPDVVDSVGVSLLRDRLDSIYGETIPKDIRDRTVVNNVLKAMGALSTSDELPKLFDENPLAYIPRWLHYLEPIAGTSQTLGRRTKKNILSIGPEGIDNGLTVMVAVFNLSTFVMAASIDIDTHDPLDQGRDAIPANRSIPPSTSTETTDYYEAFMRHRGISLSHKKRLTRLRSEGQNTVKLSNEVSKAFKELNKV